MPAYISHAIMGEQLYKESINETNIFKLPISKDELKGYCLGADLATLSNNLIADPHNFYTQQLFLTLIKYIKDNKLIENSSVMALLYGHIAHYFLDINTHPFIFYIERGCKKVGHLSNHYLLEGYLSAYLSKKVLQKNIMDINSSYFNNIDLSNSDLVKLLNSSYGSIYNDYKIIKTYRKSILIFSMLENFIKSKVISYESLINLSKFNKFLYENNLSLSELTNDENKIYMNPVTGKKFSNSFYELYNKSIEMSLDAIKGVNQYLYSNYSLDTLKKIFKDLSYDTGIDCALGKKFVYTRKKL